MTDAKSLPPDLRALVVDDEPSVRLALQHAMDFAEWHVGVAESGREALRVIDEQMPDVIVADKNMPDMSGIELLRRVRERSDDVAFVLITGYASAVSAQEAIQLDVDGYLEKPFDDVFKALDAIKSYVGRRRAKNQLRRARSHFARATAVKTPKQRPLVLLDLEGPALSRVRSALEVMEAEGHLVLRNPDDSVDPRDVSVVIADDDSVLGAVEEYPQVPLAVATASTRLPRLLSLVDLGADAVIDPADDAAKIRGAVDSLIRRGRRDLGDQPNG